MFISLKKGLEKEFMKLQQTLSWTISDNFNILFVEIGTLLQNVTSKQPTNQVIWYC